MDYRKYCLDLLDELVAIPSHSQEEEKVAEFLYQLFLDMGLEASLRRISSKSYNVTARICGDNEFNQRRKLILGGHIDTVKANDKWKTNPYSLTEQQGELYGLGAGDMKGGLAAQIAVLRKLLDSGMQLNYELEFIGLADEERLSTGAYAYVEDNVGKKPADFAIFAEPHFDHIITGASGKVLLKIGIKGKGGHAARPETGINAIDCLARFICALNDTFLPQYFSGKIGSLSVLRISSSYTGYSLSIPEEGFVILNKQLNIGEDFNKFLQSLFELYKSQVSNGTIQIDQELPFYPSYEVNTENEYIKKLQKVVSSRIKRILQKRINQSVSDGNVLSSKLNIPTILFGPKGNNIHMENESVNKESMFTYMDLLEDFILQF